MKDNFTTSPAEAMTPREKLSEALLYTLEFWKRVATTAKLSVRPQSVAVLPSTQQIGFHEMTLHLERAAKIMEDLADCQKQGATNH